MDGQIAALQRNHIYYTELRSVAGKNVKDFTLAQAKEIKLQLADNGIDVWSIGSPLGKIKSHDYKIRLFFAGNGSIIIAVFLISEGCYG